MQQQARDLLEHGLKDIYDAEQRFANALGKMEQNASDRSLADGFRRHQDVTREQVRRLEQAFDEIGVRPQREECAGARGLIEEYQKFIRDNGSDGAFTDAFAAGAGLKVEHYEIASYRALIDLAEFCDEDRAAKLLKQNLAEEEATAAELQSAATTLGAKLAGASTTAVAGRAVGSMVNQAREGTLLAVGGARAVGERAVGRAQSAIRTAERRGRKLRAKRAASGKSRTSTSRSRTSGTSRSTSSRKRRAASSTRSTAGRAKTTARRAAGTTRRKAGTARRRTTSAARRAGATRRTAARAKTTTRKTASRAKSTARRATGTTRRATSRATTRARTGTRRSSTTRRSTTAARRPATRRSSARRAPSTRPQSRSRTSGRPAARRRTASR